MWHINFYVILVFAQFKISCGNENFSQRTLSFLDLNINSLLRKIDRHDFAHLTRDDDDNLCVDHINKIISDLSMSERYAIEMIDAWGKIPSGIFFGNLAEMGHFDECLNVTSPDKSVRGRYCLATMEIEGLLPPNTRMAQTTPDKPQFSLGICVPDSCTPDFLNTIINDTLVQYFNTSLKQELLQDTFCSKNIKTEYSVGDWVAITIFSVVGFLMLFSTIYELIMNYFEKPAKPIFIIFSAYTNTIKLCAIQKTGGTDVMDCLNGIRCISIMWVVFGHEYMFLTYIPLINTITLFKWVQTYYSMLVLNATVVVDTFFVLSGLLLSWSSLRQLDRTGKLNIPMMYFHRFLRLTPVFGAAILFCATLLKYVGSGPLWTSITGTLVDPCQEYWWSAILFVQNYVNVDRMCIGHTWYLAVDTQLYVLSPLILIPMWKWKRKVIWFFPILIIIPMAYTFAVYMIKNYSLKILMPNKPETMQTIYYPTHTRFGPWLIGILLGYYLNMNRGRRIKLSKLVVIAGWILCFAVMLSVIFGPYDIHQFNSTPPTIESAFYAALSRPSWAIAIGWIVLACTQGYGGIINTFLSCPLWQPFGRLTYSIYIIHLILQTLIVGLMRTNMHFSDFDVISKFWGDFGITLSISVLMVLAFESPVIAMEKLIFKKKTQIPVTSSTQKLCINPVPSSGNLVQKPHA